MSKKEPEPRYRKFASLRTPQDLIFGGHGDLPEYLEGRLRGEILTPPGLAKAAFYPERYLVDVYREACRSPVHKAFRNAFADFTAGLVPFTADAAQEDALFTVRLMDLIREARIQRAETAVGRLAQEWRSLAQYKKAEFLGGHWTLANPVLLAWAALQEPEEQEQEQEPVPTQAALEFWDDVLREGGPELAGTALSGLSGLHPNRTVWVESLGRFLRRLGENEDWDQAAGLALRVCYAGQGKGVNALIEDLGVIRSAELRRKAADLVAATLAQPEAFQEQLQSLRGDPVLVPEQTDAPVLAGVGAAEPVPVPVPVPVPRRRRRRFAALAGSKVYA